MAACAACCIGPLLALLGGIGAASAIGAVWMPALAVVTVAALAGVVWMLRRRRATACGTGHTTADLGMPTVRPAAGVRTESAPR
ncbi:hypothetical protein DRB96_14160 [Streptomyces sp. ICC1]|nr:hypothetical protein DRB89_32910 [Streptomyces sp. ICC4]AWZ17938.1 hypothetical protein DRB96_14160 [Streptomyces sp. ICC1]